MPPTAFSAFSSRAEAAPRAGQTVPVTPAALTTVIINEKVPDAVGTSLKLSVSAPTGKAMEAGETSPKTEFTVVLENTTSRALSDAVLTYEDGMTVMDAERGTVDPVNHTITFSTLLADEKKTVTISKADSNHGIPLRSVVPFWHQPRMAIREQPKQRQQRLRWCIRQ